MIAVVMVVHCCDGMIAVFALSFTAILNKSL